ncbi:unnamed protein product, partial [Owenia fusiformis]
IDDIYFADINECSTSPCNVDGTCTNTQGSFKCTCNMGYQGDGFRYCLDFNECNEPSLCGCDVTERCVNRYPSFECQCLTGYERNNPDDTFCTDIDECIDGPNGCSVNATCINVPGSYNCTCGPGCTGEQIIATADKNM